MSTDWFTYHYERAEISRWKEIITKTVFCSIKHGFKPVDITNGKKFYWKSLEDLIKEIEQNFSKYNGHIVRIGGLFGDYGLETWVGYSLDVYFFLGGTVTEKDAISVGLQSDDERWLKSGNKAKKDFNNFLKDLEGVLGLKVI